jgi:cell pole-organizing protein PopZ
MTAAPFAPGSPPPPGGPADPSMEDILASIRRILSEDEAEAAPSDEAERLGVPDVLALDSSMLVEVAPPQREPTRAAEPPTLPPPAPADPHPQAPEPMPVSEPTRPMPQPLLGAEAAAAASSSVGSLLRTLVAERQQVPVYRGGPTIEDLVREEVRPLLKEWLDSNLPPLVERLVRVEIERLVGRSLS